MANLELENSLIGVRAGLPGETERTLGEILTILKKRGEIEEYGTNGEITGFNFGENTVVNVGYVEETKVKTLIAEFTITGESGEYYVQVDGKKYPITKTNGNIKIDRTEITTPTENITAEITGIESENPNIATAELISGEKDKIKIIGVAIGSTTITVNSGTLTPVEIAVNVRRSTTLVVESEDSSKGTVMPNTSIMAVEGEKVRLSAYPSEGYQLAGWFFNGSSSYPMSAKANYEYEIAFTSGYRETTTVMAKFEENTSEIPKGVNSETYGKYVNYNINLGIGNENSVTDDWKVFYDDGTNIFLIAADFVPVEVINQLIDGDDDFTSINNIGAVKTGTYSLKWVKRKLVDISGKLYVIQGRRITD